MTKANYSDNLSFKLTLLFSLFSLFVSNHLNSEYFYFACYGLILSFGIIHGANDILILLKDKKKTDQIILKSTMKYLFIVLLISSILQWTIFGNNESKSISLFYFFYGLFIFFMLFEFNKSDVSNIVLEITKIYIPENVYSVGLFFSSLSTLFLIVLNFKILKKQLLHQLALLVVMLLVFFTYELLPAFAIYFVFFHSIPSIIEQYDLE